MNTNNTTRKIRGALKRLTVGLALAAFALAVAGTARADTDAYLTATSQIRSAANNPPFGALTENVAAVNLTWYSPLDISTSSDREAAHGALAGGTLNGIAFHDILLGNGSDSATGVTVVNAIPGVTMDYTLEGSINRNFVAAFYTGPDAAVLYNISATNPSRNSGSSVTFHGLTPNNDVYVQLIGGNMWGNSVQVTLNGGAPVSWTSSALCKDPGNPPAAADGTQNSALLGITTTANASGNLTIDVVATSGNMYYGIGAITVAQKLPAGSTATTTTLLRSSGTPTTSTYGDSLIFAVTVSGGTPSPSGTVTLKAGATTIGSGTLTTSDTNGICTITNSTLAVTHDPIVAVYGGDSTYAGSTSSALDPDQTVNPATPIVTVTGPTSFTYNGNPQGPTTATTGGSTGAVTFQYDGTGSTTYGPTNIPPTDIGTYTCTATVAADPNYLSASSSPTAFTIDPPSPPPNDNFADAIALTGAGPGQTGDATAGTQTGTDNIDATQEEGEPVHDSGATSTAWFKWTCAADGQFTISTVGSTALGGGVWDAVLGIYTGESVAALTPLLDPPQQDADYAETATVPVTAGTTYYVQTAGWGNGLAENILLTWSWTPPSTACDMVAFGPGAVITGTNIAWTVPYGTTVADLAPTFTMSPLAACNNQPNGGIPTPALSTTTPVTYTVTAEAGNTKDYAVLVTVAAPDLVIGAEQYSPGVGQSGPPSPTNCVSGDLLEMSGVVAGNERTTEWRSGLYDDGVAYYDDNSTAVLTYTLDLASNPAGYDIKEIRAFSGWDSYRSGQSYDLSYSLVGAPDTFVALGTVLTGERNGAVMTRTYHTGGATILTGVAKIRFNIRPTNGGGETYPPGEGYGTVWREFDVTGSATAVTTTPTATLTITNNGDGNVTISGTVAPPTPGLTLHLWKSNDLNLGAAGWSDTGDTADASTGSFTFFPPRNPATDGPTQTFYMVK